MLRSGYTSDQPQTRRQRNPALPSSSISSASISSPESILSALISPLASFGRLNDVLRLEAALPDRPDEFLPTLDNDALREDGPEAIMLVGESGLGLTLLGEAARAPRRRSGISTHTKGERGNDPFVR